MDATPFLWISTFGLEDDGPYRSSGFAPAYCGPGDIEDLLPKLSSRPDPPVAIFIGEGVHHPVAVARQAHRLHPAAPIVFLAENAGAEVLRKELSFVSMVGDFRTVGPADTAAHLRILEDCRKARIRRRQVRTTLDRANFQLTRRLERDEIQFRKLFLSDRYLTSVLEQARDAILSLDPQSRIVTWNRGAEGVFGWTASERIGHAFSELTQESEKARMERLVSPESPADPGPVEGVFLRKDGATFHGEMTRGDILDEGGILIGRSLIIRDISSRKRLEADLAQALKMEAVGKLAGGIAHDFNNLLTAINGYADLVREQLPEGEPLWEMVGEIRKSGERATALTGQLLAYSRRQIMIPQLLDVNALVADMGSMLQRLIGEHLQLEMVLDPGLGKVKADRSGLEQIIMNLVLNARDAMPQGGRLTIETANRLLDENYVSSHLDSAPGPHVMLAVSDTGVGMTPEVKARVFDPFFTTKEVGKGTGLGLSSVYGAVKQSGGSIWVYSEPGIGSTFKIYFPAVDAGEEPQARKEAPRPAFKTAGRPGASILLVEDEETVRRFAARVLIGAGYHVLEAADGRQALELVAGRQTSIDLLVTDIVMPGMTGKQLEVLLYRRYPDLKVLFISGYTENAIVHHGTLDPGVEFLQKPFSHDQLLRRVEAAFAQPRAPGAWT